MQKTAVNNHRKASSNADVSHSRRIGEIGRCKVTRSITCTHFLPCTVMSESYGSDACNEIGPCIAQTGKRGEWSCEPTILQQCIRGPVEQERRLRDLCPFLEAGWGRPCNSRDCRNARMHAEYSRECVSTYLSEGRCAFSQALHAPPCTLFHMHAHTHTS